MAVEHALRATAAHNPPPGVSVVVNRSMSGVRVQLSGPGARKLARSMSAAAGPGRPRRPGAGGPVSTEHRMVDTGALTDLVIATLAGGDRRRPLGHRRQGPAGR